MGNLFGSGSDNAAGTKKPPLKGDLVFFNCSKQNWLN